MGGTSEEISGQMARTFGVDQVRGLLRSHSLFGPTLLTDSCINVFYLHHFQNFLLALVL